MSSSGCIALAGNPNSGKTSLFNALTGLRQRVANYPGITVERKSGTTRIQRGATATPETMVEVIDLPGTYSLIPTSPDEQAAMEVLRGLRPDTPAPDVIVAVVDAANLARNLYLVSQLLELGRPMVVALTMTDVAARRGQRIDLRALAAAIGCAVVPVIAHDGIGIEALRAAISAARTPAPPSLPLTPRLDEAAADLAATLSSGLISARRLLLEDPSPDLAAHASRPEVNAARDALASFDPVRADVEARYRWIEEISARCTTAGAARASWSERLDHLLLHRVWGLAIFAAVMGALFVSIFWLAAPLQGWIEGGVAWLGGMVADWTPSGLLHDLVAEGVFPGVGAVVVFVPQIALLFIFLALLEDSGYLARAAFLMDRLLCRVGLHGKSFIPLLSSFACAIPGILAARTMDSRRERLRTILVAPFMSCSARLPVYALVIAAFFAAWHPAAKGALLLGCYLLGILAAVASAWVAKLIAGSASATPFILELPVYQRPHLRQVGIAVWTGVREFLLRAGTIIFCLSVLVWAMTTFPRPSEAGIAATTTAFERSWTPAHPAATDAERQAALDERLATVAIEGSIAGHLGHAIAPVVAPLGFDWKIGVGLVGAFAAREVFVSTLGITYSVQQGGDDEEAQEHFTARMVSAIHNERKADGTPVWTTLTAITLLVWFVLAMQCVSTTAIIVREAGGWRWGVGQIVYMNGLAWLACFAVYQIGRSMA
jgi:ferrous iron transport protein B